MGNVAADSRKAVGYADIHQHAIRGDPDLLLENIFQNTCAKIEKRNSRSHQMRYYACDMLGLVAFATAPYQLCWSAGEVTNLATYP